MKTTEEIQAENRRKAQEAESKKSKKSIVKDTDADGSSPYVDLDKSNFSHRPHGRTTSSLGPDHEPGTV